MDISRRTFLAWSAAVGASLPLGEFAPLTAAPVPPRAQAQPTVVFTKPLQWLDYDGVAEIAAEAGFNGLDIPVRPGGHVLPERIPPARSRGGPQGGPCRADDHHRHYWCWPAPH
jgi:hypothetical protein